MKESEVVPSVKRLEPPKLHQDLSGTCPVYLFVWLFISIFYNKLVVVNKPAINKAFP